MKTKNKSVRLLCIGLVLILVGSIFASIFHSGLGAVKVKRISFDAAHGTLSGLLYMPDDASESNPKPTVIVTHGYLNSSEMQDLNAIELSRRGFVVLALDQYDHGHSTIDAENYSDTSFFGLWLPFWANSMNDAVQYMYEQPYVLKDADGNGIIGVTGHSMGGFSSTMALAMDELQYAETGVRKIYAGLTEGSDFSYTAILEVDAATSDALGGGRIMGKVAAQYDEFFFNDPAETGGTVRHKDYVSTPDGLTFLQQESSAEANTWYDTADGGKRIIYQPAQTHPWNHFSGTTAGYVISFYQTAFADYADLLTDISASSQVWQWKEAFECLALIGFIMFLIAVANLLLNAPFFKAANLGEAKPIAAPTGGKRVASWVITIIAILLPGIVFTPLMDDGVGSASVNAIFYAGIVVAVIGVICLILSLSQKKGVRLNVGSIFVIIGGACLALIAKLPLYSNNGVWTALGVNSVAYWTIACAAISLSVMALVYVLLKAGDVNFEAYGVNFQPKVILSGVCVGVCTVVLGYVVLFLIDAIFKTDFRIWTFAFKTFDANIIPTILKYLPTFLLFYIVSTASIAVNTNTERTQGLKGYIFAILLNAGGAIIWLGRQYITLFSTGVSAHPGSALSGIVLVAMVPTLSIAAIISRNLYKKSGNIWSAACLNALLMTTMTIANTMVAMK